MSAFAATLRREALQSLVGGRAWTMAAAIAALTGLPLAALDQARTGVADFAPTFSVAAWCVLVAGALLGAASLSGDRRNGTWELVVAGPARPADSVWGKSCALAVACAVLVSGFPLQAAVEAARVSVDWASVASGMAALWLLGMATGAAGLAAASLVRSGLGATVTALLSCAAWVYLARSAQVLGDPWTAAVGYALDPVRRVQECAAGSVDLGSVAALLGVWASCTWLSARWADAERRRTRAQAWRRRVAALVLALPAAVVVGAAVRGPGAEPPKADLHRVFRVRASEALQGAMRETPGPVHLTLLSARGLAEPAAAAARQAVERAEACVDASGSRPAAFEVDLLSPLQAGAGAKAIERMQAAEAGSTNAWRQAFDRGLEALEAVWSAAELPGAMQQAATRRGQDDPLAGKLLELAARLQRGVSEGPALTQAFQTAAACAPERPLGDLEGTGRVLAAELGAWARTLRAAADALAAPGASREHREMARRAGALCDGCRTAQDLIDRLPPLRLTEVAAALRSPPVVVVTTPQGCAAVPAYRLMEGPAAADQALADTLAAAKGAPRSAVVFVHAGQRSPLEATASGADFALVADALRAARLRVEAWNPAQQPRPSAREARRRAWVIVPPFERRSLEADAAEQAVLEAAARLLREGEPVFVLLQPSVAASMGMVDPWSALLRPQGLEARTDAMVVQLSAQGENARQLRSTLEDVVAGDHVVGAALHGRVQWPTPMPLRLQANSAWTPGVVARVEPLPSIWVEEDPRVVSKGADAVPAGKALHEGDLVPLLAVSEGEGRRVALAGGLGWALGSAAGLADARGALRSPGNRDLFVGTVRWLVGEQGAGAVAAPVRPVPALAQVWLPAVALVLMRAGVAGWRRRS